MDPHYICMEQNETKYKKLIKLNKSKGKTTNKTDKINAKKPRKKEKAQHERNE